jgi:hypothetical protein
MSTESLQFDAIFKNGWRQGSVLDQDTVSAAGLPLTEASEEYYVILTHSCDLTRSEANTERKIEVVRARVPSRDENLGNFKSAKNPRMIVFQANVSDETVDLIAGIETREFVDRSLLINYRPHAQVRVPGESVQMLARWMARRYSRPAFPNEFNRRLRPILEKFGRLAKRCGKDFSEIRISLSSWDELEPNQIYQAKCLVILKCPNNCSGEESHPFSKDTNDWAKGANDLLKGFSGIEFKPSEMRWEHEISILDYKNFALFDLEFISLETKDFEAGDLFVA